MNIITIHPDPALAEYLNVLCLPWIYQTTPQGTMMKIDFGQKMSNDQLFQFFLDFKNWDDKRSQHNENK